jgi:hypothetical protein
MSGSDHIREAMHRAKAIEKTEAQLSLGQLISSPTVHAGLSRSALRVQTELRIALEDEQIDWGFT